MMPGRSGLTMRMTMLAVLCVFAVYAAAPLMLSLNAAEADPAGVSRQVQPVATIGLLPIAQSFFRQQPGASDNVDGGSLILRKKRAVLRQNVGERLSKLAASEAGRIPYLCAIPVPDVTISRPAADTAAARSVRGFHLSFSGSSPPLS